VPSSLSSPRIFACLFIFYCVIFFHITVYTPEFTVLSRIIKVYIDVNIIFCCRGSKYFYRSQDDVIAKHGLFTDISAGLTTTVVAVDVTMSTRRFVCEFDFSCL
jgi:hypothetical protein